MVTHSGEIQLEYRGRIITILYQIADMAGTTKIYIEDKNKHSYPFIYRHSTKEWLFALNYTLKWPADFFPILFEAFEEERLRWGL